MEPSVGIKVDGNGNIVAVGDVNVAGNVTIYQQSGELRNADELLKELRARSRKYYEELTGANGPYRHLNIAEAILAGLDEASPNSACIKPLLASAVQGEDKQALKLEDCLPQLWLQPVRHALLLGEGGTGKTVSLLNLWRTFLDSGTHQILPLFIALHEYNTVDKSNRQHFITSRIAWHYLGKRMSSEDTLHELWEVFVATPKQSMPKVVLLLDGFNEVTAENRPLLMELQDLRQKGQAVQLVLTSRYGMSFTWAEGFHHLLLQPVTLKQVSTYLQAQQVVYPDERQLQEVLQNPMMLTLYASANEMIEQYKYDTRFAFTPTITTQGELLWNYLEAQLVKLAQIYDSASYEYHYYKFLLKHFLPFIGYVMQIKEQYTVSIGEFTELVNEACAHFFTREFISSYPEYSAWLGGFDLAEKAFPIDGERSAKVRTVVCWNLRIMQERERTVSFLHQNLRDIFAAVYIVQDLQQSVSFKQVPASIKLRPLSSYLRRYVGEISGEQYYTDAFATTTSLLRVTLSHLRGVHDIGELGYAVWNLVAIWKDIRSHLADLDFSCLNLSGVRFNDVFCYHRQENRYRSARFDGSLLGDKCFLPQGHVAGISCIASSPSGQAFASGCDDGKIKYWNIATGECLGTLIGHVDQVTSLEFTADGHGLISGSADTTLKYWHVVKGLCVHTFQGHRKRVSAVAVRPGGMECLSSSSDTTIRRWDIATGACLATLIGHTDRVTSISISPDGQLVVSGCEDGSIRCWEIESGTCITVWEAHEKIVSKVAFAPDGRTIFSSSWDHTFKRWETTTGRCVAIGKGHRDVVNKLIVTQMSELGIISGSNDNVLKYWDGVTGECVAKLIGHYGHMTSIAATPNGKTVLMGSESGSLQLWDIPSGETRIIVEGYTRRITHLAISQDGRHALAASYDKAIQCWSLTGGKCTNAFKGHQDVVSCVAYSPDEQTIASGSWDKAIKYWNIDNGVCLATLNGHTSHISSVAFGHGSNTLISASWDGTVKCWDLRAGECLMTLTGHTGRVTSVALSLDGDRERIVSASEDATLRCWDVATGECLMTLTGHTNWITSVAVSPDGKTLVSSSWDKTIRCWNRITGECITVFKGHQSVVSTVVFGHDSNTLISASWDGTVKCWDLRTGECLMTLTGHTDCVTSVALSLDGKILMSVSEDGSLRRWDLESGVCVDKVLLVPGILLAGCSFKKLHPESCLTDNSKKLLRRYGSIFDEQDQQQWNEVISRV